MSEEIKIIDVIQSKGQYSTQTLLVLNRKPEFKYEKSGKFLIAEDGGFFNFYKHERPTKHFKAFAGREFDIAMKDGSVEKANGQWWNYMPEDYDRLVYQLGASTVEELGGCYVFCSIYIDRKLVDDWLSDNEPSNNYYKYDSRSADFEKQVINSKFD